MIDEPSTTNDLWADDYLERRDEALYLTKYLEARYQAKKLEQGFVLAVNGDWGLGKSFMIDRWSKDLEIAGHPVVMFNSWENDFTPEPLVAFIAELNSAMSVHFDKIPKGKALRKKWMMTAKAVLVPALKIVGMAAIKHTAGIGLSEFKSMTGVGESADGDDKGEDEPINAKELAQRLAKVVDDELKSHGNVKVAIKDFRLRLAELVGVLEGVSGVQLPIFVFIDELDRCRPDYAIKLLEGIKHLFGIPGIHFIVATNLSELAHSVRAVYGEQFSAERYLKRFFDMEYSLPEPEGIAFAAELMVPLIESTSAQFITGFESIYEPNQFPAKNVSFIFERYAQAFGLRLRDQQQASKVMEAALLTLGTGAVHIHFLIFLVALYQKNSQFYHQIAKGGNLNNQVVLNAIPEIVTTSFKIPDPEGNGRSIEVSIKDVGDVYFSLIAGQPFDGNRSYYFPYSLILNSRDQRSRRSLSNYVEIVRRAGQFSK